MILVLGTAEDRHAAAIYNKIVARGKRVAYFDSRLYPKDMTLTFDSALPMSGTIRYRDGQSAIDLSTVNCIYCRQWDDLLAGGSMSDVQDAVELRETESSLGSLFRGLDCFWVNSIEALNNSRYRIHQLQKIRTQGVRVPEIIVSNDFRRVQAFFSMTEEKLLYRPSGWNHSSWNLAQIDDIGRHISDLPGTPVEYQENIPGDEVRAYVIGDSVFAGVVESVESEYAPGIGGDHIRAIELPAEAKRVCIRAAATLDLLFCSIDMRITPEGDFAVVDVDANPMFLHFEQSTRLPISDRLVELLIAADVDAYQSYMAVNA